MNEDDGDDPFACFDDSSDDDESDDGTSQREHSLEHSDGKQQRRQDRQQNKEEIRRDPGNGVLSFHAGTEVALLYHVRTELAKTTAQTTVHCRRGSENGDNDEHTSGITAARAMIRNAQTVLDIVDSYCLSRHWMMHVGPEKAKPLRRFIGDCLVEKGKTKDTKGDESVVAFVELGTYCGYSSIFIAKTVLEHYCSNDTTANTSGDPSTATDNSFSFHIYSVEVVEKFATVAKELIRLAGMEDCISIILVKDPDEIAAASRREDEQEGSSLASELKRRLPVSNDRSENANSSTIDFLFVDHDKSMYLPHLRELEDAGMVRKGTHVAADNVVFAEIHDYRHYMAGLADKGIVSTRLEDSLFVEYCQPELIQSDPGSEFMADVTSENKDENNASTATTTKDMLRDGIEFSVYLLDPL